jgi:hypothetical protein
MVMHLRLDAAQAAANGMHAGGVGEVLAVQDDLAEGLSVHKMGSFEFFVRLV